MGCRVFGGGLGFLGLAFCLLCGNNRNWIELCTELSWVWELEMKDDAYRYDMTHVILSAIRSIRLRELLEYECRYVCTFLLNGYIYVQIPIYSAS